MNYNIILKSRPKELKNGKYKAEWCNFKLTIFPHKEKPKMVPTKKPSPIVVDTMTKPRKKITGMLTVTNAQTVKLSDNIPNSLKSLYESFKMEHQLTITEVPTGLTSGTYKAKWSGYTLTIQPTNPKDDPITVSTTSGNRGTLNGMVVYDDKSNTVTFDPSPRKSSIPPKNIKQAIQEARDSIEFTNKLKQQLL
jgi:hypothetical protein